MRDRSCFALGVVVLLAAPLSRFIVGGQAAMVLAVMGGVVVLEGMHMRPVRNRLLRAVGATYLIATLLVSILLGDWGAGRISFPISMNAGMAVILFGSSRGARRFGEKGQHPINALIVVGLTLYFAGFVLGLLRMETENAVSPISVLLAGSLVYFAGWLEKPDAVSPPPSSPEELEHD